MMVGKKRVAVFDVETDPFQYGRKPEVFLIGVCDGEKTIQWWGKGCVANFMEWLADKPPMVIYAHNGGKFDFFFLRWPVDSPKIIAGRIAECKLGNHTFRDSFCILPFALAQYEKTDIDYAKFEASARESHKAEIMAYHRDDLRATYELVSRFIERFGFNLTVAATALKQLSAIHPVERKNESHDFHFRRFLYGGRVQCFNKGLMKGDWRIYDVNSMYPYVMREFEHPIGRDYVFNTNVGDLLRPESIGFVRCSGKSLGGLPHRLASGRLSFESVEHGEFHITLHEFRAACELGLFTPTEVAEGYVATETTRFEQYVDKWMKEKIDATNKKDEAARLFAKLMLNSSWGKLAANPEKYFDWQFLLNGESIPDGWEIKEDHGWLLIIRRPSPIRFASYYDVATGASITGAARSVLMRALARAKNPVYCDTDSIICEGLDLEVSETRLGAWKLESQGDELIVLGRKLYSLSNRGEPVKSASKGVNLKPSDFLDVLEKGEYIYCRDAPTFRKSGECEFIKRTVRVT